MASGETNCPFSHSPLYRFDLRQVVNRFAGKEKRESATHQHMPLQGSLLGLCVCRLRQGFGILFNVFQYFQPFFITNTGKRMQAGTVGFSIGCLENKRYFQCITDVLNIRSYFERHGFVFNYTRTGN